jgi:hypothetical protein
VVVTNVFGHQADVAAYEAWCTAHGKLLLFDNAATATGRLPDGRCVHDAGDGAILSLHETKPIGRGEGGAVIAPPDLSAFVTRAMNFGFDVHAGCSRVGHPLASNHRMSDVAAAAALDHLDTVIEADWVGVLGALAAHAGRTLAAAGFETHQPMVAGSLHACLFLKVPPGLSGEAVAGALCTLPGGTVEAKQYYRPLVGREEAPPPPPPPPPPSAGGGVAPRDRPPVAVGPPPRRPDRAPPPPPPPSSSPTSGRTRVGGAPAAACSAMKARWRSPGGATGSVARA